MSLVKKALRTVHFYMPVSDDTRYTIQRKILRTFGLVWRYEASGLTKLRMSQTTILDIGANRGFSIEAWLKMAPAAKIVGFEPNLACARVLNEAYASMPNVRIEPVGLGRENSQLTLFIPEYRGVRFDPIASTERDFALKWINADRVLFFDPARLAVKSETITIRRLDDYDLAPSFVKIYAQGVDQDAIAGGERTFRTHRPVVLAPWYNTASDAILRDFGYDRYGYVGGQFVPEPQSARYCFWYLPHERAKDLLPKS